MSSFLCSAKHLATIAAWARLRGLTPNAERLMSSLRSLNNAALACRYGDKPTQVRDASRYIHAAYGDLGELAKTQSTLEIDQYVHALLACLEYQCFEGDVMDTHRYAPRLERLTAAASTMTYGKRAPNVWTI